MINSSDFDNITPKYYVDNNVKEFRRNKNFSQEILADMTGLSQNTISDIENHSSCSIRSALLIAKALDVSVDDLFYIYLDI